jgi:DMSO reductase iron-sulfur subunit
MSRLAFYIDSSTCSGCKACQAACKDKNGLEVGRLFRRVYEVTGGEWIPAGPAWTNSVFAYYLSVACNHCARPICLGVCPAGAIDQRPDGIVWIDPDKCLGCKYCSFACPYGAPQYNEAAGVMTKCDFCKDEIDAARPPACVAACPMRALDYGPLEDLQAKYGRLAGVFPMPEPALTEPSIVITPHRQAQPPGSPAAEVENREEVKLP